MLRIYFTADDIARTRLATAPDPLWELMLSLQMLRGQRGDLLFTRWRRRTAQVLRQADLGDRLKLLVSLSPELGYFPDFLNPADAIRGLEYGLEAIRCTPKQVLQHDIAYLEADQLRRTGRALPAPATELAEGDARALQGLTDVMRTYYQLAIEPHQHGIGTAVEADRQVRLHAFGDAGIEGLLQSLRPMLAWESGELQVPAHRDQEIYLDGRGLMLIPSYFCIHHPVTMFDPSLPPVLIYPIPRSADALTTLDNGSRVALAALIGQTRAAMLHVIGAGCTTSELARRVGVSAASASEQAAILRAARLITSHRDRNRMVHQLTRLGTALLHAG